MIEIIPATDIIGGQCVRLTQGDYASRKTYYRDPLEAAFRFEEAGIRLLHMVDLDGAKASEPRNLAVLERIAARTSLEVQYGGGIKSREALHSVFDAGARRAICGSVAVRRPDLFAAWLAEFGPGRLIVLPVILVCVAKYSGLAALAPHGETLIIISLLSVIAPSANIVTQFSQMFGRDALYASLINTVTMLLCIITMPLMITLFQM